MTREEALAIFEDNDTVIENPNYLFTEIGEAWDLAIEALKSQKQGEWITKGSVGDGTWCSECETHFDRFPNRYKFCPNCGTPMNEKARKKYNGIGGETK